MKNLIILFLFLSCSNLSKTMVQKGDLLIRGGKSAKGSWTESLALQRVSWFKDMTLFFDLAFVKLDESSPFKNWLSSTEERFLSECSEAWIVFSYSYDSDKISQASFFEQVSKKGIQKFSLNDFSRQVKMHPDYEKMSLIRHKVTGLCGEKALDQMSIEFPGFKKVFLGSI